MSKRIIQVNTSILKTDISDIETEIRRLRTLSQKLHLTADQLGTMWEGNAKNAFMTAVKNDLNKLEVLISAIEKFTNVTEQSRKEYDNCEKSVAQIISSIRV